MVGPWFTENLNPATATRGDLLSGSRERHARQVPLEQRRTALVISARIDRLPQSNSGWNRSFLAGRRVHGSRVALGFPWLGTIGISPCWGGGLSIKSKNGWNPQQTDTSDGKRKKNSAQGQGGQWVFAADLDCDGKTPEKCDGMSDRKRRVFRPSCRQGLGSL